LHLNIAWRIDTGEKCIRFCTEPLADTPGVALCETAEETLRGFLELRAMMIEESKNHALSAGHAAGHPTGERSKYTSICEMCSNAEMKDWGESDGLIHYVNLSMEPAPCECKCFYCDVQKETIDEQRQNEGYENVFNLLELAQQKNIIAADAKWQVSSNEITIHPHKDRIFGIIKDSSCNFYTNCFIFDERIAANLAANPRSSINLSIDSGTKETWRRVKGADNFGEVRANLAKYAAACSRPEQITLKYLVFPGVNDGLDDYLALTVVMQELQVRSLTIACDLRTGRNKYSCGKAQREPLICAAGRLAAVLHKNGFTARISENGFFPDEAERALSIASELLASGDAQAPAELTMEAGKHGEF